MYYCVLCWFSLSYYYTNIPLSLKRIKNYYFMKQLFEILFKNLPDTYECWHKVSDQWSRYHPEYYSVSESKGNRPYHTSLMMATRSWKQSIRLVAVVSFVLRNTCRSDGEGAWQHHQKRDKTYLLSMKSAAASRSSKYSCMKMFQLPKTESKQAEACCCHTMRQRDSLTNTKQSRTWTQTHKVQLNL